MHAQSFRTDSGRFISAVATALTQENHCLPAAAAAAAALADEEFTKYTSCPHAAAVGEMKL